MPRELSKTRLNFDTDLYLDSTNIKHYIFKVLACQLIASLLVKKDLILGGNLLLFYFFLKITGMCL